jgi:hypothetical protein
VYPIEKDLLPRVRDWLLTRRDKKGQFLRGNGRYGFGHAPPEITNAYIWYDVTLSDTFSWALTESGEPKETLVQEIQYLIDLGDKSKKYDPYFIALLSRTLSNVKMTDDAERFGFLLTEMQHESGAVIGKNNMTLHDTRFTTITYSWGDGLSISATSLAVLAWLKCGKQFEEFYEKAMNFLRTKCKGGAFGDTQSTILCLKAIVEYDKIDAVKNTGSVIISLDDKQVMSLDCKDAKDGLLEISQLEKLLKSGKQKLSVKVDGDLPGASFSWVIEYNTVWCICQDDIM